MVQLGGEGYVPGDSAREETHSEFYGYASGLALTTNVGKSYYLPNKTFDLKNLTIDSHISEWSDHFQRMINFFNPLPTEAE